ncbi:MAG: SLC13 family permease [Rhodospirillaceae bacterium]|nr:SLC13 family permease [Rhodospirillaceae bacterium]
MTADQIILFTLFALVLGLMLWGRLRHDLVAAGGLFAAVVLGVVPEAEAFSGFAHPAVVIVALVLIASRALENSGALGLVAAGVIKPDRGLPSHIAITGGVAAALSAVINNVAALALVMSLDIQAARKAGRSPGLSLMPLAFASILGGMITLIGTPPNIVASTLRAQHLGEPYRMFDFAPVGLAVAAAGLAFVALIGWRLLPSPRGPSPLLAQQDDFIAELEVAEGAPLVGKFVADLTEDAEKSDVLIVGLIRGGKPVPRSGQFVQIEAGDLLSVEGTRDAIAEFMKATALVDVGRRVPQDGAAGHDDSTTGAGRPAAGEPPLTMVEVIVRSDSPLAERSAESIRLRSRYSVTLLGIARAGRFFREQVRSRTIEAGDLLLIAGKRAAIENSVRWLGLMAVAETSMSAPQPWRVALAVGLFVAAIVAATSGVLSFTTALAIAVAGYGASGLIPAREFYDAIDWPVVVMLACFLPMGAAFDAVGGTALIANVLLAVTQGESAVVALVLLMMVVMTLSDVLNNVATMVIAGPVGVAMARELGVNPDTFLMGVAVAASCAFLTPIGHQNNTLVMGPGGYAFSDYWRLGLPLEAIVLIVGVPTLLMVWPL